MYYATVRLLDILCPPNTPTPASHCWQLGKTRALWTVRQAEYAIAEQSEAYPRLTLAKIIIAEQSQAYPPINSS